MREGRVGQSLKNQFPVLLRIPNVPPKNISEPENYFDRSPTIQWERYRHTARGLCSVPCTKRPSDFSPLHAPPAPPLQPPPLPLPRRPLSAPPFLGCPWSSPPGYRPRRQLRRPSFAPHVTANKKRRSLLTDGNAGDWLNKGTSCEKYSAEFCDGGTPWATIVPTAPERGDATKHPGIPTRHEELPAHQSQADYCRQERSVGDAVKAKVHGGAICPWLARTSSFGVLWPT